MQSFKLFTEEVTHNLAAPPNYVNTQSDVRMRRWWVSKLRRHETDGVARIAFSAGNNTVAEGTVNGLWGKHYSPIPADKLLSVSEHEEMLRMKRDVVKAKLALLNAEREVLLLRRQKADDVARMEGILKELEKGER